ncbi:MAG: ribosome silencing factor [Candidatus Eremiobacteraeota bacterium]|nr:ribosome silencing factor [Candidatus Eremiobacteraeota bacterium]
MAERLKVEKVAGRRNSKGSNDRLAAQRNGMARGGRKAKPLSDDEAKQLAHWCSAAATDKKAENVVLIDIRKLASFADFFVIATGRSIVQVRAIADAVVDATEARAAVHLRKEGYADGNWVLVDYGAVIVHVFTPQAREFYNLERLWGKPRPAEKKR